MDFMDHAGGICGLLVGVVVLGFLAYFIFRMSGETRRCRSPRREHTGFLMELVSNFRPYTSLTLGPEVELVFDVTLDQKFYEANNLSSITRRLVAIANRAPAQ